MHGQQSKADLDENKLGMFGQTGTSKLLQDLREVHRHTVYVLQRTVLTSSVVHAALQER